MTTYQRMGEWLVSAGLITEPQLREALRAQRAARGRLGEVLTAMGLVTEEQLMLCLSAQYSLPIADLDKLQAEPSALRLVSHAYCQGHLVLPWRVRTEDGEIEMVCSDPIDVRPTDELTRITKKRVRLSLATPTQLYRAINKAYALGFVGDAPPPVAELKLEEGGSADMPKPRLKRAPKIDPQTDRRQLLLVLNEAAAEPSLWDKLTGS